MKRICTLLLVLTVLLSAFSGAVLASEETADLAAFALSKPAAPVYLMYEAADRTATEGCDALYVVRQANMDVLALSAEYESDRDAFLEKYGLYDFLLVMQFDTSLDGTDNWNYTPEWDTDYNAPGAGEAAGVFWIGSAMMEKETVFDLYTRVSYDDAYSKLDDAIIQRNVPDGDYTFQNFYFDHEDHSLYVRVRYYMEWETWDGEHVGERQSKYSEWSDVTIFGKDGNGVTPDAPTDYEAPVISELQYVPPGEGYELGHLTYMLSTPEQVWNAGIYYKMTGDGYFDGLETEISIDDGEWQPYNTVNSGGDWCLWNGARTAFLEEPRIEENSHVKLRVRYLGAHGPSEWSNVLELNGGGTQQVPEATGSKPVEEKDVCTLCGFCPVPFGLCIFIWLAIVLAIVVVVIVILVFKPKKCKQCGAKLEKGKKFCGKCGAKL